MHKHSFFNSLDSMLVLFLVVTIVSFQNKTFAETKNTDEFSTFETQPKSEKKALPKDPNQAAKDLLKQKKHQEVIDLLWPKIQTLDKEALIILCQAHQEKKEGAQLLKVSQIFIAKFSESAQGPYFQALAYTFLKQEKEAIEGFKETLILNPKYEPAYMGLIQIYENKKDKANPNGNIYELRILYQDMIDKIGPLPRYFIKLCEIYFKDRLYDNAIETCQKALLKNPKSAEARIYLGLSQISQGQEESGVSHLKRSASEFKTSMLAQSEYAKYLADKKNHPEAKIYFEACKKIDAKNTTCLLGLANACYELQSYDCSIENFTLACNIDRTTSAQFRKAAQQSKLLKNDQWSKKFDTAAEKCTYSGL
ncbi:MAG: tetratricopeptide repeat protein [Pseudobdellovibrionaceae bacterium]